jgi:predicted nucleic acid-binding protein
VRVVLDASAAIEVALNRKKAQLLGALLAEADEVLAPELFIAEVTNVIWKYHHIENLDLETCERALGIAVQLPDSLTASIDLHREAFLLARTSKRPAYDMFYLALARREDAAFVTLDGSLRKEAEKQGIRVI